jgi:hypothetical protein
VLQLGALLSKRLPSPGCCAFHPARLEATLHAAFHYAWLVHKASHALWLAACNLTTLTVCKTVAATDTT